MSDMYVQLTTPNEYVTLLMYTQGISLSHSQELVEGLMLPRAVRIRDWEHSEQGAIPYEVILEEKVLKGKLVWSLDYFMGQHLRNQLGQSTPTAGPSEYNVHLVTLDGVLFKVTGTVTMTGTVEPLMAPATDPYEENWENYHVKGVRS